MAADKKWITLAVCIVLLFTAFVVGNKYWFYPEYTAQIIPEPAYSPPADLTRGEIIKPFEGTLKKILEKPDETAEAGSEKAGVRNPFISLADNRIEAPKKKPQKEITSVEIPNLGLIITGNSKKIAMLDGNIVREGDYYGDHVVGQIEPKHVDLSGVYGKLRLRMPTSSFGNPEVVVLEESAANMVIELVYKEKRKRDKR